MECQKCTRMWYFHDFVENALFDMMRQNRRIGLKRKTRTPSFGGDPWRLESVFLRSGSAMEPPPRGVPSRGGASDVFRMRSHVDTTATDVTRDSSSENV